MDSYLVLRQLIVAVLLVTSFAYFIKKVRWLIALMRSVQGQKPATKPLQQEAQDSNTTSTTGKIQTFISDIVLQNNVRRKFGIGLAHLAIFYGFLFIQPHSLELMIRGIIPSFSFHTLSASLYTSFLVLAEWVALVSLAGFGYALYRRLVDKPSYLPKSPDAAIIITFSLIIVSTFFVLNAFAAVSTHAANTQTLHTLPVSGILVALAGMEQWSDSLLIIGFELVYWLHLLTICAFLMYIPNSKHLHLLAAVPNVLLKPEGVEKAIAKTDIEDEEAESFGLATVQELHWKQVLELYSCTECGRCQEQCPASTTGKILSPREFIHCIKEDVFSNAPLLFQLAQNAAHKQDSDEPFPALAREGGHLAIEQIWDCTSCRACEEVCPVNIQHLDFMFELRKQQVLMEAAFPAELGDAFTNIENQSNPWGFPAASRSDWAQDMNIPLLSEAPDAEIVYFPGSALSLEDRGKEISRALMKILQHAGVRVAITGPEEQDTGDDARRCGNEYLAQMMMQTNAELLSEYKVQKILTACPHTFNILKNEYPQFGFYGEVIHHSQYLLDLIQSGRLTVSPRDLGPLTYHDSCYLGRWNAIFDAPRQLLKKLHSSPDLLEIAAHREKALCCGGGGGRMFMEEDTGSRINVLRSEQALHTGAKTIAVACPYCLTMLTDGVKEHTTDVAVKDLAEILAEGLS